MVTVAAKVWLGFEVIYELVRARVFTRRGLQAILGRAATWNSQALLSADQKELVSYTARIVWIIGKRLSLGFTCLHRSIATCCVLQKRGIVCRLMIAPTTGEPAHSFTAHAWVEIAGGQSVGGRVQDAPAFEAVV